MRPWAALLDEVRLFRFPRGRCRGQLAVVSILISGQNWLRILYPRAQVSARARSSADPGVPQALPASCRHNARSRPSKKTCARRPAPATHQHGQLLAGNLPRPDQATRIAVIVRRCRWYFFHFFWSKLKACPPVKAPACDSLASKWQRPYRRVHPA